MTLFTNGTLLTPRSADLLAEQRPFLVEITLYGATQATYEQITGVPGSYARCRRGIELLMERDIPLQLKTMVMTHNQHELADMRSFAQSLGVGFRYDPLLNARLDGGDQPLALRLPAEQVVQLDMEDPLRRAGLARSYAELGKSQLPADQLYVCNAGVSSFHVDPYGHLCLCMMDRAGGYDLRSGSFKEGWRSFLTQINAVKCSPQAPCSQCSLRPECAQCPGWGRLEHGDPQQRVDFLCQVTQLRAQAFVASGEAVEVGLFDQAVKSLNTSYAHLDALAGEQLARVAVSLLQQRIAQVQVMGAQHKRILHDEVVPQIHLALLKVESLRAVEQGAIPQQAQDFVRPGRLDEATAALTQAHRRVSALVREMSNAVPTGLESEGLAAALQSALDHDFRDNFDRVDWQADPATVERAKRLPLFASEVIFFAAQEAIRNAARHGRGGDARRPLHLDVTLQNGNGKVLQLIIGDDGVGRPGELTESESGSGLRFHGAMLAVIGGTLSVVDRSGGGTQVVIEVPEN